MSVAFLYHHPIKSFVNLGEIFECGFEVFENRKMLLTKDVNEWLDYFPSHLLFLFLLDFFIEWNSVEYSVEFYWGYRKQQEHIFRAIKLASTDGQQPEKIRKMVFIIVRYQVRKVKNPSEMV